MSLPPPRLLVVQLLRELVQILLPIPQWQLLKVDHPHNHVGHQDDMLAERNHQIEVIKVVGIRPNVNCRLHPRQVLL